MDVHLNNANGTPVAPLAEILTALAHQLQQKQDAWRQRLRDDPRQFGDVEVAVHHTFQQLADQVVAGLLTEVGQSSSLENARKKSR
jgi:hypothetical protein